MKTSIIIPAYNEERGIGEVLGRITALGRDAYEIIVVDDGSTDGTSGIAEEFDVKLIRHGQNRGKGSAIRTGVENASGDYVVFIDADNTYPAETIPKIVEKLDGGYDIVICSRALADSKGITAFNRLGNALLGTMIKKYTAPSPPTPSAASME
jgi:glycosyltransferase involved in cell wall biosynthesis